MKQVKWMVIVAMALVSALAAQQPKSDVRQVPAYSAGGIEVGMSAQQVLDKLGRMPDKREDRKQEIVCYWKLPNGDLLQVRFRGDFVVYAGLQFHALRPVNDFNLMAQGEATAVNPIVAKELREPFTPEHGERQKRPGTAETKQAARQAEDPRVNRSFRQGQTVDQDRTTWTAQQDSSKGYRIELIYISASKKAKGKQAAETFVEFCIVSVATHDVAKFERVVMGSNAAK